MNTLKRNLRELIVERKRKAAWLKRELAKPRLERDRPGVAQTQVQMHAMDRRIIRLERSAAIERLVGLSDKRQIEEGWPVFRDQGAAHWEEFLSGWSKQGVEPHAEWLLKLLVGLAGHGLREVPEEMRARCLHFCVVTLGQISGMQVIDQGIEVQRAAPSTDTRH